MSYGYCDRILHVDLTEKKYWIENPGEKFYRKYWGGRALALYYMLNEMKPGIDPFSPDNLLIFATSVVVGSKAPMINRYTVCAKSPLTNAHGEAEAGGYWGPELKKAGFDAIIIKGISQDPVYLYLKDTKVEIRNAQHLWGKDTLETQELLREECNDERIRIAQIGPAGENLVYFANIVNELHHFNGRNGLGAVMGSKKLKAIVVRGNANINEYIPGKINEITRQISRRVMENPLSRSLREKGTIAVIDVAAQGGWLPTRNWSDNHFEEKERVLTEEYHKRIFARNSSCYACPIACKRESSSQNPSLEINPKLGGPEYETLVSLGPLCGVSDLDYIAKAGQLCNQYAVDTISMGMTIAFAMQCYEEGILTKKETDGLELNFGNKKAVIELIKKIVFREGIGELLRFGTLRASKKIGKGSEKFVHQVKGQEIPMHDPRVKVGVALQYALADYGADHMKAAHDGYYASEDGWGLQETSGLDIHDAVDVQNIGYKKVALFKKLDIFWSLLDILGVCHFGYVPRSLGTLEELLGLICSICGWRLTWYELMKLGERSIDMARIFNLREGITAKHDRLPDVFFQNFKGGLLDGKGAIDQEKFQEAIHLRYEMMGWDRETGIPSDGILAELGLEWLIPEVEKVRKL
ncbi:MAG: aldehyde ferredoxin oxidoreductase family protein [Candidatus Atribacteria bacterium]|nr:aldehyde ferredoxin oxidoreductase family protein [Candidatus Atribacteria bacterium]